MVETARRSKTLTTSWIILFVLGVLLSLLSLVSIGVAYFGEQDVLIQGVNLDKLAEVDPRLPNIIRGRRATASAASLSLGMLMAWVAATAYRRGERWAWSALLGSVGAGSILSLLRYMTLQTTLGLFFAGIILGVLVVALLIAYKDFH